MAVLYCMPPRIRVTRRNVEAWLRAVPRFQDTSSPQAVRYIELWNVREKIAHAKLTGRWPAILRDS